MKNFIQYFFGIVCIISFLTFSSTVGKPAGFDYATLNEEENDSDVIDLKYPFEDRVADPYSDPGSNSPLFLNDPSNIKTSIEYDPNNNQYNINENMGSLFYRNPSYLSFDEFVNQEFKKSTKNYWKQRATEEDMLNKKTFAPKIQVNSTAFDRIFGGNTIDIRPQGSAELSFGVSVNKNGNPAVTERQRKVTTFDFNEKIQLNVIANIGDKMKLATNYNTESTFDFENRMNLQYTGHEDEIIKKIEGGNVTLPLQSQLIQGSQNLFGIKTQLQFGRMMVTAVYSQQKGKSQTIDVQGGAQTSDFEIRADQYEKDKHFFLSQYFKDQYDAALSDLNQIRSGINITKIEVWVTNKSNSVQENRNIVAFTDLGEANWDSTQSLITQTRFNEPDDSTNNLYDAIGASNLSAIRTLANVPTVLGAYTGLNFTTGKNYEKIELARRLNPAEYTLNPLLGYISLNMSIDPTQVLAVAYEYTLNGRIYQVGELSTTSGVTGANALFVKLIKGTYINPKFYTWDLMMKNIYSLGAFQVSPTNFRLDVLYQDDRIGSNINYIPAGCADVKGIPLIQLFNLDDLNTNNDPQPDGVFDFKPGITINPQNGRIIFPVREPFGSYLETRFCGNQALADFYIYEALYDSTKNAAQQQPEKNKFILKGSYQSSGGSDIPLNATNVQPGSVRVTAGGLPLTENVHYTVDYVLGRVKIIDSQYLNSNTPIQVSVESNELFNIQTKRMIGARFDYYMDKNFSLGGTFLNLTERPLTQKTNVGDDPISNTVIGADGTYKKESRALTKLLDKLPIYSTKEPSNITVAGEVATLIPGHAKAIGKSGTSYIDDFEGAITPFDIKNPGQWYVASTPLYQTEPGMFPEGDQASGLAYGFNRAKLAWYYMDPIFQRELGNSPPNITADDRSNNYVREIPETEIFPKTSQPNGVQSISCLNLAFYPTEKGPYNYDVTSGAYSAGISADGSLVNPKTRWGGIMRRIETTDFEASNIETLEFWLMDPFANNSPNNGTGGDLYFNLGDISEDILRDGRKTFENGLTAPNNNYTTQNTIWGRYPDIQSIVNSFDNDQDSRQYQDVGLDGFKTSLSGNDERAFFDTSYLQKVATAFTPASQAYTSAFSDPSSDDFLYFQSNTYDNNDVKPLERYKKFNGLEGNSPAPPEVDGYNALATYQPDIEDVNRDNNLDGTERYFQYKVELKPGKMVVGQNYITNEIEANVSYDNGTTGTVKWYQFKIPIRSPEKVVNGIEDFTTIRFIRMFLKNFDQPIICRFAKLQLLRGDWRRYNFSLLSGTEFSPTPEVPGNTKFDISAVSYEENSSRTPIPYVLPPGVDQEQDYAQPQYATLNEQSLSLKVCDLEDGDSRAAYKTTDFDIRSFKKLKMYVHAESTGSSDGLRSGDLTVFVRLGSDLTNNYYEYEIPLKVTAWGSTNPADIWPSENNLDIELSKLIDAKIARNNAITTNPNLNLLIPFTITDGDRKITVKGSPNISSVRSIMIGVRNPKSPNGTGAKLCGEVWVNELRLSDFDEKGGWAATARVTANLADLGTMSLLGNRSTAGWGSIEKKVNERDREYKSSYDFSTSVELGKFIPGQTGISVPMFFNYAEQFINPQYNPLDPDVTLKQALKAAPNNEVKDSITKAVQDYTKRKSINFTNVRKNKTEKDSKKDPKPYDIENLNMSYAYNEVFNRNYNVEYNINKTHLVSLGYNYNTQPKPVTPLSKSNAFNSQWFKLIKDFNFNYSPSNVSFVATLNRGYQETQLRNNTSAAFKLNPTYVKTFTLDRIFGFQYDLTKSLKFDFNSNVNSKIDEPYGRIDTESKKDSVRSNLLDLGRLMNYHHTANVTYNVPIAKIPYLDWITFNIRYGVNYGWQTGNLSYNPLTGQNEINSYANTIQNSQNIQYNLNFNMATLYNRVSYLKKINQESQRGKAPAPPPKPKLPKDSLNKAQVDSLKKPNILEPVFKELAKLMMMVKTVSFTFTETNGISVPGFRPRPDFLGMDWGYNNGPNAPGLAFVSGSQNIDQLKQNIIKYNWLTDDTTLNTPLNVTKMQNLSARATLEPIKNFRIELSANRNYSFNRNEYFRATPAGEYNAFSPTESGNFSMSYILWNTSFIKDGKGFENESFENFSKFRTDYSRILSEQNPNSTGTLDTAGYYNGFGATQMQVLSYSFLTAYSGKSPSSKYTEEFPKIPYPNWRITYDGISKMPWARKIFQQFTLSHGYRSNFSINSFTQNLLYAESADGHPVSRDVVNNIIPRVDLQQISLSEQFSPLIGVDMTFKNSLQARFEIRKDRTLALAYSNIQVTEVRGKELTIGLGYKIKGVKMPFAAGGKKKSKGSDLNLKADFNIRDNNTVIRKLVENTNQASAGNETVTIKFTADYNLTERFNVSAYFDRTANNPFVSSSYPTAFTSAGIRLRFTLAQ